MPLSSEEGVSITPPGGEDVLARRGAERRLSVRTIGWIAAGAGLLAGALIAWTPGGAFLFGLAAGTFFVLWRRVDSENRQFVAALFAVGFCLRAVLSLGLDVGSWWMEGKASRWIGPAQEWNLGIVDNSRMYLRMGDSDYYSARGYALSEFARGMREPVVMFRINQYGWNGYVYVIGWFYHLFGYSPYAVKLINCLLGALLGPLIFLLARSCFDNSQVARWASVVVAFFPTLLLWSVSNLKDVPLIFLTLVGLLVFQRILQARQPWQILNRCLLLAGLLYLHTTVRSEVFTGLMAGGLILSYFLTRIRFKGWPLIPLGASAAMALWLEPLSGLVRRSVTLAFHWHIGFVQTEGIAYRFLPVEFYGPESSRYLQEWQASGRIGWSEFVSMLKAMGHYLLEPIPGLRQTAFAWVTWPQMAFWYVALALSVLGICWSVRHRYEQTLSFIVLLVPWTVVGALTNGNVGTAFRIRDMVTPFYLMFACMGLWILLQRKTR